jgi:hypothetical protein
MNFIKTKRLLNKLIKQVLEIDNIPITDKDISEVQIELDDYENKFEFFKRLSIVCVGIFIGYIIGMLISSNY